MGSYWTEFCVGKSVVKHNLEITSKLEEENKSLLKRYDLLLNEYIKYQKLMSNRMYLLLLNNKDNVDLIVNSEGVNK